MLVKNIIEVSSSATATVIANAVTAAVAAVASSLSTPAIKLSLEKRTCVELDLHLVNIDIIAVK